jgi:hypothetical protein
MYATVQMSMWFYFKPNPKPTPDLTSEDHDHRSRPNDRVTRLGDFVSYWAIVPFEQFFLKITKVAQLLILQFSPVIAMY